MPHRHFTDSTGARWDVWDVDPAAAVETLRQNRARDERAPLTTSRLVVSPSLAEGWLCFERAGGERRRLAPVPRAWHELNEEHLEQLCATAASVAPRRSAGQSRGSGQGAPPPAA